MLSPLRPAPLSTLAVWQLPRQTIKTALRPQLRQLHFDDMRLQRAAGNLCVWFKHAPVESALPRNVAALVVWLSDVALSCDRFGLHQIDGGWMARPLSGLARSSAPGAYPAAQTSFEFDLGWTWVGVGPTLQTCSLYSQPLSPLPRGRSGCQALDDDGHEHWAD